MPVFADQAEVLCDDFSDQISTLLDEVSGKDFGDILDVWMLSLVQRGLLGPDDYSLFMRAIIDILLGRSGSLAELASHIQMPATTRDVPLLYQDEFASVARHYQHPRPA